MTKHKLELRETVLRSATVEVEADSLAAAVRKAHDMFNDGSLVVRWIDQNHLDLEVKLADDEPA